MDVQNADLKKRSYHPLRFLWRVLVNFKANQGLVFSGAVAYYILLSIIPFFTLILVALSHVVSEQELLRILNSHLRMLVPGIAGTLLAHATTFLQHRHAISWIGIGAMLFFSSFAFAVLENTFSIIFHHRLPIKRRHAIVSAVIPYMYIMLLGIAFFLITFFSSALHLNDTRDVILFHWMPNLGTLGEIGMHLIGILGMLLLLTSFYMVMPRTRIRFRHALTGGLFSTVLWEITRHFLAWYFENLSMVNLIYGSLATVVVALLSLEAAGMILLLGAEVVAEYGRLSRGGTYEDPVKGLTEALKDRREPQEAAAAEGGGEKAPDQSDACGP